MAKTILLMDFDPCRIEKLERPLAEAGYRVLVVQDGVAGLAAFESERPDLVLIEPMIPKKNGFQVCREIKRSPDGRGVPVVIATAFYSAPEEQQQAYSEYGCDAFLVQPVGRERLLDTCERLLCHLPRQSPQPEVSGAEPNVQEATAPSQSSVGGDGTTEKIAATATPRDGGLKPSPRRRRTLWSAVAAVGVFGAVVGVTLLADQVSQGIDEVRWIDESFETVALGPLPTPLPTPAPVVEEQPTVKITLEPVPEPILIAVDDREPWSGAFDDEPMLAFLLPWIEVPEPPAPPAQLVLAVKSSVRTGRLVVFVDGKQVYTRELVSDQGKVERFFKKMFGAAGETFEVPLPLAAGAHEIVARVIEPRRGFETGLSVEAQPGENLRLKLTAGRAVGRRLTLAVDDSPAPSPSALADAEPQATPEPSEPIPMPVLPGTAEQAPVVAAAAEDR